MKDDLWRKRPTMEDDLKWKMTLNGRQHLFENNIQLKMFQDSTLPYLCDVIFMVDSDIVFNLFFFYVVFLLSFLYAILQALRKSYLQAPKKSRTQSICLPIFKNIVIFHIT